MGIYKTVHKESVGKINTDMLEAGSVVRYYRYRSRVSSIGKVSGFFWYRYRSEYRVLSIENRYQKCTRKMAIVNIKIAKNEYE